MTPEQFKREREKRHFSQGSLAKKLDVSRRTVIRWEVGQALIPAWAESILRSLRSAKYESHRVHSEVEEK